jgi:hypothetical protein
MFPSKEQLVDLIDGMSKHPDGIELNDYLDLMM